MRILIAVHGYPPTHAAGGERVAERYARWLRSQGESVEVFAVERADDPFFRVESAEQDGILTHRVYYDVKRDHEPFHYSYNDPLIGMAFANLLHERPYDLVHVISGYRMGGQVIHTAKNFNLPVLLTLTEYWFMCFQLNLMQANGELCSGPESDEKCALCLLQGKRRYRLLEDKAPGSLEKVWPIAGKIPYFQKTRQVMTERRETLAQALQSVDTVISPSRTLIDKFTAFGYDTSRFCLIRHGIPVSGEQTSRVNQPVRGALRLGFIGQLKPHKGLHLVIEALLPLIEAGYNVSLDIWGQDDPGYTADLRAVTAPYPQVRWNGTYGSGQVWSVLSNMDVLIMASRWYENSPLVINEAMYMGVPVIVTQLGGMAELVEDGRGGLSFELNNVSDLSHQIKRLLDEPHLLEQLRSSIPRVKTLDDEMTEVVGQYNRLLEQAR